MCDARVLTSRRSSGPFRRGSRERRGSVATTSRGASSGATDTDSIVCLGPDVLPAKGRARAGQIAGGVRDQRRS